MSTRLPIVPLKITLGPNDCGEVVVFTPTSRRRFFVGRDFGDENDAKPPAPPWSMMMLPADEKRFIDDIGDILARLKSSAP